MGREGPSQFRAVAAVCPAMDLAASSDALHSRSNRLYEYYFIWKLRRRLRSKARLFPKVFETSRLRGVTTLREFDDKITAHYCGFTGAIDYYERAAAANVVDRITSPLSFCTRPTTRLSAFFRRREGKFSPIRILSSSKPRMAAIAHFSLNLMEMMAVGQNRKSWNFCEGTERFLSYTITSNEAARENPNDRERGVDFRLRRHRGTDFLNFIPLITSTTSPTSLIKTPSRNR